MDRRAKLIDVARGNLLDWRTESRIQFRHNSSWNELCWLFNVSHAGLISLHHLEVLSGPHGYAYYKMLVARKS